MFQLKEKKGSDLLADLEQTRLSIGRDPANDIVLDDDRVSGFHAAIITEAGHSEVVDLGSTNGTSVNGQRLQGKQRIKAWDLLSLGGVEIEICDTEGRRPTQVQVALTDDAIAGYKKSPQSSVGNAPVLKLLSAAKGGSPALMNLVRPVTIGRVGDNDIVIADSMISSHHARVTPVAGGIEVKDMGSTNGTWINGQRIQNQLAIHGDRIRFDMVEYEVVMPNAPQATASQTVLRPAVSATQVNPALQKNRSSSVSATVTGPAVSSESNNGNPGLNTSIQEIRKQIADRDSLRQPVAQKASSVPASEAETRVENPAVNNPSAAATVTSPKVAPQRPAYNQAPQRPQTHGFDKRNESSQGLIPRDQYGLKWLLFSFDGRLPRLPYFWSVMAVGICAVICSFAVGMAMGVSGNGMANPQDMVKVGIISTLIVLWPAMALLAKRCHDIDVSAGWMISIVLTAQVISQVGAFQGNPALMMGASLVNFVAYLYVFFAPGTSSEKQNPHGPVRDKTFL